MTTSWPLFRSACGLLLTGIVPLAAQQTSALDREVEFVRRLAADLGFIALANGQVDVMQKKYRDSDDFKRIQQLGIDISLLGARADPRPEERRRLFKEAVERSREFVDHYRDDPVADQARRTLLEASFDYGRFLVDELEVEAVEHPEKLPDLRKTASEVFQGGIEAATQVMTRLEVKRREEGSPAQRSYYASWLYKAMLQREFAGVAEERDRKTVADMARETFEELILAVGEETLLGQRSWFEMAKLGEVLGNQEDAFRDYESTIETIRTSLDSEELELPEDIRELMINLMQEAYDRAADTLFALGRIDDVLALCTLFREELKKLGGEENTDIFEVAHARYGHPVFLTEARAMAESGKAELLAGALALVQRINDAHPSDMIGVRAKRALREILEGGATVNGTLLFEVAKGAHQEREFERAIRGFKRAYGAMTDDERKKLGLETWTTVATDFGLQKRYLEATLAAMKGLEDHGSDGGAVEVATEALEKAWNAFVRDAKEATPDTRAIGDKVSALLKTFGGAGSQSKQLFRDAARLANENKYAEAAADYEQIQKGTPEYEPAQAMLVQMWQRAGDFAKARAAVQRYRDWLQTPEAALPSDRRELADARENALTTIDFFASFLDYLEASGTVGGKKDPTRYEAIIANLKVFIDGRGMRDKSLAARCWDMTARLQAELGQLAKAEEGYRTVRSLDPNSPIVPALATAVFKAHYDQVKAIETEMEALVTRKAPEAEFAPVQRRLEAARRAALAMVVDYATNSASPAYDILYTGVSIGAKLADWPTVERLGRKTIELFGEQAATKEKVEMWILPNVGEAMMRQRKFREAVEMLSTAEKVRPDNYPLKRLLSLAQGGWFYFDPQTGNPLEEPALDDPAPAYDRYYAEYQKYALNPQRGVQKFSLEWYEFQLEAFMLAKRAGRKDQKYKGYSESIYRTAKATDEFLTLENLGPEGKRLLNLFKMVNSFR
ncbi:MAG: hypothetical protein HZB39_00535 [Planctomycetes bacterium]|nr:hypothetical protein [Planctomycetota bacterium]